ncbi:MAG TPA: hypothetical protein VFF26_04150 [Gallionella sp.]|nr:hypothetical protein [Gallionella sp.]
MNKCPICNSEAESRFLRELDGEGVNCPRCGQFRITREASVNWRRFTGEERLIANACGWIREHQNELINSETVELIETLKAPTVTEKANRLLRYLGRISAYFGEQFGISLQEARSPLSVPTPNGFLPVLELMGVASTVNGDEVVHLLKYLEDERLLEINKLSTTTNYISVSAGGFSHIEQLAAFNPESNIGFCAMWFDDSVNFLYDKAIEPAIGNAGYRPFRIDKEEHVNRIDDEIFANIRSSRFVVADFTHGETGVRGGVYFEAGFAQGLGLPVIWTCRSDMLSEAKLHFDIRQYNFLEWTDASLDDFKDRLQKRIEAILGRGTWKPE